MTLAATMTVERALMGQVDADIERLRSVLTDTGQQGYEVTNVLPASSFGWAPHDREGNWDNAVLHVWKRLEGGPDAYQLWVELPSGAEVWLDLRKPTDE